MSKDEEYLDSLLKSIEETPTPQKADFSSIFQEEKPIEEISVEEKPIEEKPIEEIPVEEKPIEEIPVEEKPVEEFSIEEDSFEEQLSEDKTIFRDIEPEEEPELSEDEAWKESLDQLLEDAAQEVTRESISDELETLDAEALDPEFDVLEGKEEDDTKPHNDEVQFDDLDVTDIIDHMDGIDEDLSEISELLKKTDSNETIDAEPEDDLQELLNSVRESEEDPVVATKEGQSKKKKLFAFPFGKKKKAEVDTDENADKDDRQELTDSLENQELQEKGKEKPKGFWKRLIEELTREEEISEETEAVNENEDILKELEEEDLKNIQGQEKKGKKKKEKKKKEKKGKKAEPADEGGDAQETGKKKKRPERPKKEKGPKEKSPKVLSRKMFFVLIAFCATIIAAVVLLSIFLSDYADKKKARAAFFAGDYSKVYEFLYDKKLNPNDKLIFDRANVVLKLQRRLDSYELNKRIGKDVEALDALLQGVAKYDELIKGESFGASEELQALYLQILSYLDQNYAISEEEAKEINSYDNDTYSRKVYSVVYGEDFAGSPEAQEESGTEDKGTDHRKDILPEEEEVGGFKE